MANWIAEKKRVIEIAEQEFQLWSADGLKEWHSAATPILEKYWRSVKSPGRARTIVEELQADPEHLLHPWSASFISWVMKTAGAAKFKKSSAHHVYVADAKHNRQQQAINNPFWAYRINEVTPEAGDLLCQRRCLKSQYLDSETRPLKCATYNSIDDVDAEGAQIAWRTHCDIVTKVRPTSIDVIGGNVRNSVSRKTIPLDAAGFVRAKTAEENQYIAIVKFREARFVMNTVVSSDTNNPKLNSGSARAERVTAGDDVVSFLESVGSGLHRQVRITKGEELGLYTLVGRHSGNGLRMGPDGLDRLGLADANGVDCKINARSADPQLSEAEARDSSELVERASGSGHKLIALAPHGGKIEEFTDRQAERVRRAIGSSAARSWRCMGWNTGGGASRRWHITSTEISELSFPRLGEIFEQTYTYAVAFHGWSKNYVGVGGRDHVRRDVIAEGLRAALAPGIEVRIESSGALSGNSIRNLVNRITTSRNSGVHIEQPLQARRDHWELIADTVAEVYRSWID